MADDKFFYKKADFITLGDLMLDLEHEIACEGRDVSQFMIKDVAPLAKATKDEISFFSNIKYKEDLKSTDAGVIILEEANLPLAPEKAIKILSSNPYLLYAKVVARLYPDQKFNHHISASAIIDASANIGENCYIGHGVIIEAGAQIGEGCYISAHAFIGKGVIIGKNTVVKHNCTLEFCYIGDNCLLHPGVRIGQDGFGFANNGQGLIKVKQLGRVVIGNYVEIGANSCIDRGALDDTIIGDGTKIDNLVQIGHNVTMGRSCIIVAQVGIAGSTKIGDGVVLGGQVGVSGHISIGSGAMLAAKSGVVKDVEPKAIMGGLPAVPIRQWHRQNAILRDMAARKETEKD